MGQRWRSIGRVVLSYALAVLAASLTFWVVMVASMWLTPLPGGAPPSAPQVLRALLFAPAYAVVTYPVFLAFTLPAGLAALFVVIRLRLRNPAVFVLLGVVCAMSATLIRPVDRNELGRLLDEPILLAVLLLPGIAGGLVFWLVYLWKRRDVAPDRDTRPEEHVASASPHSTGANR